MNKILSRKHQFTKRADLSGFRTVPFNNDCRKSTGQSTREKRQFSFENYYYYYYSTIRIVISGTPTFFVRTLRVRLKFKQYPHKRIHNIHNLPDVLCTKTREKKNFRRTSETFAGKNPLDII